MRREVEEPLEHAVFQHRSWHGIVNDGLEGATARSL
jgi:hypothetical protein